MKLLIIFIYLITVNFGYAAEKPDIKNLVLIKNSKMYKNVIFKDINQKDVNLDTFKGKLLILNFWATWCAPCIEEMPSLNRLQANPVFNNLQIIPINVGRDNVEKSKNFYKKLKINNLEIYFDKDVELANKFLLRGLPTTVFINKKGEEFARVLGFVNFDDNKIIKWLQKYD